jgi:hypothetical protein
LNGGKMSRYQVHHQTIEFGNDDIHLPSLRDNQQFSDDDQVADNLGIHSTAWPIFGVL